uniref:DUF659 domain-containing protein n=1 Tax=Phaseolus vulgaris TaxID=3885 RepID=V7BFH1_PHAVU|nr:hypothetical protein PHAVU_007G170700g [Phaseolus vulgaris]ESW16614.1 hypothetical protein PHAVU_007G170700g [Phaseolus vulgaris]
MNIPNQAIEQEDETKPLWRYVSKLRKTPGGGNNMIKCSLCNFSFNGSYTQVRAHLLKLTGVGVRICPKVTPSKLVEFKKLDNEATLKIEGLKQKEVHLPPVSDEGNQTNSDDNPKFKGSLQAAFNIQARDTLDCEIARMFYSSGLPFHLSRSPYYRSAFSYAANTSNLSEYVPPTYNKLRGHLLSKERSHVENLLQPIQNSWNQKGVTIVSDGWSDPQRKPLIDFMATTESGSVFLKSINRYGEIKDKDFIAKHIRDVIMEVGQNNVVQIITDNADVCKAAGMLIELEFPSIYWSPCVVHTLNLALQNICAAKNTEKNSDIYHQCSWISQIVDDATFVKNFIMGHSMRLSMFNNFNSLKLLSLAPTRFASTIVMLKRFRSLKKGLQEMVISDEWSFYKEDNVDSAQFVKETLLTDHWWMKVDYILAFIAPIYDVLRKTDTNMATLHLIYEMWDSMIENVRRVIYHHERKTKAEYSSFFEVVKLILMDRWTKSNIPLHCLAHSLNPRYYSHEWLNEDSKRLAPHQDVEITHERNKCFMRYFDDADVRKQVNIEFVNFSNGREDFADVDSLRDRKIPQNTKKRKLNCGILQEMIFHLVKMEFLRLLLYLLMNQN